jgi:hypothetical protein
MRWSPPRGAQHPPLKPALLVSQARPLRLWPFALVGVSSVCIAQMSLHPRLKLLKDSTGWTLRYDYAKDYDPGPVDKGLELPSPLPTALDRAAAAAGAVASSNTKWILDTGANSHMCTNRDLMHSYSELGWGQTRIGFRGANGAMDGYVGIGDCTLSTIAPASKATKTPGQVQKFTLQRVHLFPTNGYNLISWSAMKRGAMKQGKRLKMVENDDWSLSICSVESRGTLQQIMRFKPVNGLYVLEQPD